ncbi:MAG: 23S rRNA (adenine(2503)-C(2))-methyltransferase RlmN [Acidobacteriota bacterium]|nr:23S rRNA (adenine(2503)-C(2))-methyltransferase RlmN [Acidobacteriota bacterium]MDH3786370.1 23S rRNA (adenine(2503)-C(2))-methyltransferase RlmN [Acidobacteriota bacterium]
MAQANLYGRDRASLREWLTRFDAPPFHADQLYRWWYARRRFDPDDWTDLPVALRHQIAEEAVVDPGTLAESARADDGTVKYLVTLGDGRSVESVYMEQDGRVTLCISSQVGCALDCDFCLTARMGFVRHCTPGEIVGQVARIQDLHGMGNDRFNVVFMGMGEPLHNFDGVVGAVRLLTDADGFGLSWRRVTVSTSGMVPAIERLAEETVHPRLAVSLNATTDETRSRIMPINRKYPIARLIEACKKWTRTTGQSFTFEYVLLDGVNCSDADVDRLAALTDGLAVKVNLIPFNPVPELLDYNAPSKARIFALRDRLLDRGVRVSIRWSRGQDAKAACGQLALLS